MHAFCMFYLYVSLGASFGLKQRNNDNCQNTQEKKIPKSGRVCARREAWQNAISIHSEEDWAIKYRYLDHQGVKLNQNTNCLC